MSVRRLAGGVIVCAVVIGGLETRSTLGQAQPASAEEFQTAVVPVLTRSCVACHNDRARMGNLSLQPYTDGATALAHAEVWQKVLNKLMAGDMPPRNAAPLAAAELAAVTTWLKRVPGVTVPTPVASAGGAGRVTARRLNRVEYNNTIRDLLGVAARPADQFPVDDSGYGFDNNGDVLSVSPLLMEKYMQAAKDMSRLAVYGEPVPEKPTRLVRLLNRRSPDAHDVLASGNAGGDHAHHDRVGAALAKHVDAEAAAVREHVRQVGGPALLQRSQIGLVALDQILGDAGGVFVAKRRQTLDLHFGQLAVALHLWRASWRKDQIADAGAHVQHRADDLVSGDGAGIRRAKETRGELRNRKQRGVVHRAR
jgi:hypothetical protein